jgi:predicted small integral membrane protein
MIATASGLSWMAWTWHTAAFWVGIVLCLTGMAAWEWRVPGGSPRRGVLGLDTTRGDRLFVALLAAAFVHLGWLALLDAPLWGATALAVALAVLVFRFV